MSAVQELLLILSQLTPEGPPAFSIVRQYNRVQSFVEDPASCSVIKSTVLQYIF